ncbi:DsrE family protein [Bradyrhizobium sp. CB3481]|uniref:DsrE family protein n=1 Tax=Bradyrhizobium sp. CB3481 TaxID=3039158 RepID=UPI0024B239E3|nr:DsrE family protein [Bradyrhizobium sp. CB3481]WFU18474.1 DsrE family protein [Bradyrhizobium sp. CB3481]
MTRPFAAFTAAAGFIFVVSTQSVHSAQSNTSSTYNAAKVSAAKTNGKTTIANTAVQSQLHKLAVQVNVNDPAVMNLALNNVSNAARHYSGLGQKVEIEVVAFGPGLHMLRDDTSPVKARIKSMSESMPGLTFSACGNTRENMTRVEDKEVPLVSQAKVTESGVVRLMELQEQGWTYLRP